MWLAQPRGRARRRHIRLTPMLSQPASAQRRVLGVPPTLQLLAEAVALGQQPFQVLLALRYRRSRRAGGRTEVQSLLLHLQQDLLADARETRLVGLKHIEEAIRGAVQALLRHVQAPRCPVLLVICLPPRIRLLSLHKIEIFGYLVAEPVGPLEGA